MILLKIYSKKERMKNMKKILSVTLALIMILGVMAAGVPTMTAGAAGKAASVSLKSTAYNSNATVTIGWQRSSGGATGYQIAKKKLGDKSYTYIYVGGGNTKSYNDKSIVCGTVYYYQVRTVNKIGKTAYYSSWSNTKSITTLYKPTVTSINNINNKLNINWNSIKGVSHYRLAFKRLSDKAWNFRDVKNRYYNVPNPTYGEFYAVQVRPMNGNIAGPWSEVDYTIAGMAPTNTPVIEVASQDTQNSEYTSVVWSYPSECEKYYFYVQKAGDGYWTHSIVDDIDGRYNYKSMPLSGGNTYYFQVRALDKYGNWSPFSKVYKYYVKKADEVEKRDLRELLTSHKWIYSVHEDDVSMKLDYEWLLELKEDGTWSMDTDNAVDDSSSSHTLRGTWRLDGTALTVEMRDEEISVFNETDLLIFAEDMTDEKVESYDLSPLYHEYPDDISEIDYFLYLPPLKWYVSDKYFCFHTFIFNAQ